MRRHHAVLGTVLAGTVLFAAPGAARADAPARAVADTSALRPDAVHVNAEAEPPAALALGRAAFAWQAGDMHGVADALAPLDFALEPDFDGADRAAFLYGQALLALGDGARFEALADAVASWSRETPFTRWLAFQRVVLAAGTAPAPGDAGAVAADRVSREGRAAEALDRIRGESGPALALYAKSLAETAAGQDDRGTLQKLAGADTSTALGRELSGLARLRLATRAMAEGGDPGPLLDGVPAESPWAGQARHLHGIFALEHGDTARARALLEAAAADTTLESRDEARLALAALALDAEAWPDAWERYRALEQSSDERRAALEGMRETGEFDPLWDAWLRRGGAGPALALDGDAVRRAGADLAARAARLNGNADATLPSLARAGDAVGAAPAPPPDAEGWRAAAEAVRALDQARAALDARRRSIDAERARLERQRDYFGAGRDHLADEIRRLTGRAAVLDSLRATLDLLDARIRGVRDAATLRVARRTAQLIERGAAHLAWLGAMRHFHLEGEPHAAERLAPEGYPSSDSLVAAESRLAEALVATARGMVARAPDLIARSYIEAWRPGLIDRTAAQADRAHAGLALAARLAAAVDSNLAGAADSPALRDLVAGTAALETEASARAAALSAVRDSLARAALNHALLALESRREAIDYGLAAAAYGASVNLTLRGADSAATVAPDADAPEDPENVAWRARARASLRGFLERHPDSFARGEMRFRLADVLLTDAREAFRAQMADYVRRQRAGEPVGAPPLMEHRAAYALYVAILEEDPDFEHRDAVLFNAGMLLADDGDPAAERWFGQLVEQHAGSPYAQEAWLRMGDLRFTDRDFGAAVERYAHAAEGGDPNLRAMALYKLGWSHYNEDRFMEAADAFRTAMDLYASPERARITADIEGESETWFVHSIARAGGARAFADYFARVGERDYDLRMLMALADHFRRYSLYEEAAGAEAMCIARHPDEPAVLAAAERLPETWQRAGNPERARAAQLDGAAHFAPGGAWAKAQASDSVRAAGAAFARRAWTQVALHHHLEGRRTGRAEDWRRALELYGTLIRTWPDDPETAEFHLFAGEASARLDDPRGALAHYRAAADAGADSVAERALRQRVAVTDAWYERTRGAGTGATGSDSLAQAVLQAADELLERFPAHEGGADIRWREANLALAHGWYERAAGDFGRMADAWPADPRTPAAAGLRAGALFRLERFDAAGEAFETARLTAERAGADSIARHAAASVPVAWFRHAESVARIDSTNFRRQAQTFGDFAARFPDYEHAHRAQYRAGLAWQKAGDRERAVAAMQTLIARFPKSEFVRDAHLEIASTWEDAGDSRRAAEAYEAFAGRYPADSAAAAAWLKSADLYDTAGLAPRAESIRLAYLERYPNDHEAAMEILEPLARRDLAAVDAAHPVSALLAAPAQGIAPSALSRYLARAAKHPALASRALIAEVRFQEAEEVRPAYESVPLTQPLERSIARRQARLDTLLARYRRTVDLGVPEFAHAGAYRIGEALIGFGTALERSERPADITGDDRLAYEDVLVEKAHAFYDRGEQVWEELLRRKGGESGDHWVADARGALWKRLGERFYFRPEVEFPLVEAKAPTARPAADTAGTQKDGAPGTVARREDTTR